MKNDADRIPKALLRVDEDPLKGKISPRNEIVIDVDKMLELPNKSVTDPVLIRQIGLATTRYKLLSREDSRLLGRKIFAGLEFGALYPEIMTSFDIKPEVKDETTKV